MNASDIENMTVVTLKKELKARNLSVTGNKSELVQRLSNSVGIPISEQSVETPTQNETSTAIAEVNNIEQELNAALITSADLKDIQTDTKSVDVNDDVLKEAGEIGIEKESGVEKDTAITSAAKPAFHDSAANETPVAALTEEDRKVLRAKKFNLPIIQTKESRAIRFGIETHPAAVPSDEVMKRRAERFGVQASATASKPTHSDSSSAQDDKLKQRALRFGTASASTASKIALSSIKASTSTSSKTTDSDQQEALLTRKRRFAESTLSSDKTSDSSLNDKKLARAQRFGLKA